MLGAAPALVDEFGTAAIIDALNGFEANLRSSSSTYSSTDETQRASFASFSARLG